MDLHPALDQRGQRFDSSRPTLSCAHRPCVLSVEVASASWAVEAAFGAWVESVSLVIDLACPSRAGGRLDVGMERDRVLVQ